MKKILGVHATAVLLFPGRNIEVSLGASALADGQALVAALGSSRTGPAESAAEAATQGVSLEEATEKEHDVGS